MRTLILIFLLMGGSFLLLGQDSLILSSGEVVEGDILILYKDWIVIRPHGTKHPVEIAREGTTYRLGEDYLVRSPWSLGFRYGGTYWGTAQSLRNLLEEHGYEVPDPNQIRRPSWNPRNSPLYRLDVEYAFSTQGAFGVTLEFANRGEISGVQSLPFDDYHYAHVDHRTWTLGAYYKWFSKNRSFHLLGGPIIGFYQFSYYPSYQLHSEAPVRPGLSAGAEYSILEKRRSFLRVSVQYQWMPSVSIGPLEQVIYDYSSNPPLTERRQFLPESGVRTSYLTLSVIYGLKWGQASLPPTM